jgi:ketosteroid isomerase-like protein
MSINRRHLAAPLLAGGLLVSGLLAAVPAFADASDEAVVAKSVEAFRVAMVAKDAKAYDALAAPQMTYAHSDGHVETKAQFIANNLAGKSQWASLVFQDTKIQVVDTAAVVRFNLIGESETDGKKTPIKIGVLMVWQKQSGDWKLLARHSVKL